jgi:hypothetical protein
MAQSTVNLETEKDDMLDEEMADVATRPARQRKVDEHGRKAKGRGFRQPDETEDRYGGTQGTFDKMEDDSQTGPQRCIY